MMFLIRSLAVTEPVFVGPDVKGGIGAPADPAWKTLGPAPESGTRENV